MPPYGIDLQDERRVRRILSGPLRAPKGGARRFLRCSCRRPMVFSRVSKVIASTAEIVNPALT
jgi:hypothetical protein